MYSSESLSFRRFKAPSKLSSELIDKISLSQIISLSPLIALEPRLPPHLIFTMKVSLGCFCRKQ